jgi:hypothetical protein
MPGSRKVTPAHDQKITIQLIEHVPPHGLRGAAFRRAKKRMKELGLVKCGVPGCSTGLPVEYHHSYVEHAWQEGVSLRKLNDMYGLHLSDEEFEEWVQGPGNLEPLCVEHHRGSTGVHVLPDPFWNLIRVWRDDLKPPAEAL